MRAQHTPHSLPAFPVYSSAFISENELILGGGGGSTKSGIKNKLRLYAIGTDRSLQLSNELELESGEDAPMSMAASSETRTIICGINSTVEKMTSGLNENCRIFTIKDEKLSFLRAQGTLPANDLEDYQKVTRLSPDGKYVVVAGSHDFSVLSFPSLVPLGESVHTENEIYDVTVSGSTVVIATTGNLLVYAIRSSSSPTSSPSKAKAKGKAKAKTKSTTGSNAPTLELLKTVDVPDPVGPSGTFRSARFNPRNPGVLYTVINLSAPRTRQTKTPARQAFLCKWNTENWLPEKIRKVGDRGLTCLDVSDDGKLLAFGSSALSIGLVDANTLSPLLTILKAHEFPPTTIKFNPTSTILVSGSADNSVRLISIPPHISGGYAWGTILVFILTVIIVLLALMINKNLGTNQITW